MSTALWMAVGIAGAAGAALAGWYISRRQMPALRALDEARAALEGYSDAIEADHNAVGTVRMV